MHPISRRSLLKGGLATGIGAAYFANWRLQGAEAKEPLTIGTQRQLFFDNTVIAEMKHLSRTWHQAEKLSAPVLESKLPHEFGGATLFPGNILYDDKERIFKMWYPCLQWAKDPAPGYGGFEKWHLCYATSKDGVHWEKPNLGIVKFNGNTNNNLVMDSVASQADPKHVWCYRQVLYDPHDSDPARRYKIVGHSGTYPWTSASPFWGVSVAFSPDGLHWTDCPKNPLIHNVADEGAYSIGWIEKLGKYVMYVRANQQPRQTAVCFSDDFVKWTDPTEVILRPAPNDPPDLEMYGMGGKKYQDGQYIGSAWVYRTKDELVVSPILTEIIVSKDAIHWERPAPGKYVLSLGKPGDFDDCMLIAGTPLEVGDELFYYYTGYDFPHNYALITGTPAPAIGLAKMRLDGFVSLESRMNDHSEMTTVPLHCEGNSLIVNVRTKRGSINVAVLDRESKPIPGFGHPECKPIVGDSVRHRVTWANNRKLAELKGRAICLRFRIRNADLYSFAFDV